MRLKDHESWIRYNAPHMTVFDMMDELGFKDVSGFREFCKKIGVTPLTEGGKTRQFILHLYQSKTKEYIADRLGVTTSRLDQLYNEMKIQEPDFTVKEEVPTKRGLSVREIFQRCHIPNAHIK